MENHSNIRDYEKLRDKCITSYKKVYKDSLAFDMNECTKEERTILLQDPSYISATKAAKAALYAKTLSIYDDVIDDKYGDADKTTSASDVMKAVDARNKILFSDLNIDADESNQINIMMVYMSKEDMEKLDIVTAQTQGKANAEMENVLTLPTGEIFKEEKKTE